MDLLTRNDFTALVASDGEPHLSVYLPTHPGGSEQDPIRWRNLLAEAETRLEKEGLRAPEARQFLAPARALLEDPLFWKNQSDGLAFFLAPPFLRLYRLPTVFDEFVAVGVRFHVKPLLPLLSHDGRFYVLALSQNGVRLLQGTRSGASAIDLTGVPRSLAEALLRHDVDEPLTFHTRPAGGLGSWGAIFHGHGVGIDDHKDDLLRYFQQIDRGLHPVLRQERAPLVLAAVEYLQPLYRRANTYAHLLEKGMEGNPDRLSAQELHQRAWDLVRPAFEAARAQALALYHQLAGTGRTSANLKEIVPAAYRGEIETLLVALDRPLWGRYDPATHTVHEHDRPEPGGEDLLNYAAVCTLRHGQTVHALGTGERLDASPLAAIFRLPLPKRGPRP